MSVVFNDFLQSAEDLLNNPNSKEIDFRNLISRSYYALFHLSREVSKTLPKPTGQVKRQGSHEEIIAKFESNSDASVKQLGRSIQQLKKSRCKADYDIHTHIRQTEAKQHFFAVKALIKKLQQLQATP
jgi:uncharacterized protein (UPF0332 family)